MDSFFSGLALVDIHRLLIRNITSTRILPSVFDDLSEYPEDWIAAQKHEAATRAGTYISQNKIIDRPFEESDWFNAIGFPFRNWMESRFCDGSFGIWYGSDTIDTSIHETAYHWRYAFLADAGYDQMVMQGQRESITSERKVYRVRCHAALIDFRQRVEAYPDLVNQDNYGLCQQIGMRLKQEGHPGLTTRSARCAGDNFGILNPSVLSSPQQECSLIYRLTGEGVEVEREPEHVATRITLA